MIDNHPILFKTAIPVFLLICCLTWISCSGPARLNQTSEPMKKHDPYLAAILRNRPHLFDSITNNAHQFRVQIIYTQIDRKKNNTPRFTNYYFNVDPETYFYPASTVKLPVALLALQKLNKLKKNGVERNTTMITGASQPWETEVYNDPTAPDCRPTVEHYIKKIFLVSDNDASNRLYEFISQEYANRQLHKRGYRKAEILHRLGYALNTEQNRFTNPISFHSDSGTLVYSQPPVESLYKQMPRSEVLGTGYMSGTKLINEPFSFSSKNRLHLEDLHNIIRSVLFPKSVSPSLRFKIAKDDYPFLKQFMSQYPGETAFPSYSRTNYPDNYCKFFWWGDNKEPIPSSIRIFNKVGNAYGFLTDAAYIVDFDNKVEFMLSATIYCNSNGIFNDDKYEYDTIGYPFLKNLGKTIYDFELTRPRKHQPDLSEFRMSYDKAP